MVKKYPFQEAKAVIHAVCDAADAGGYPTRDDFMDMLARNPHIAAQGYNMFGKVFFWNQASAYLYGHRESDAVNQDLFDLVIPPEMRQLARDAVQVARKTGKMPDPSPCDLLKSNGEYITVYSGHLVFQWDDATTPEFYCLDLALETETAQPD